MLCLQNLFRLVPGIRGVTSGFDTQVFNVLLVKVGSHELGIDSGRNREACLDLSCFYTDLDYSVGLFVVVVDSGRVVTGGMFTQKVALRYMCLFNSKCQWVGLSTSCPLNFNLLGQSCSHLAF